MFLFLEMCMCVSLSGVRIITKAGGGRLCLVWVINMHAARVHVPYMRHVHMLHTPQKQSRRTHRRLGHGDVLPMRRQHLHDRKRVRVRAAPLQHAVDHVRFLGQVLGPQDVRKQQVAEVLADDLSCGECEWSVGGVCVWSWLHQGTAWYWDGTNRLVFSMRVWLWAYMCSILLHRGTAMLLSVANYSHQLHYCTSSSWKPMSLPSFERKIRLPLGSP